MPAKLPEKPAYLSWTTEREKALAFAEIGRAYAKVQPTLRAAGSDIYYNIAPNDISVRDEFSREDYNQFRPGEATPKSPKWLMKKCFEAYDDHGIVRNTIDLMSDFSVQGMDINHPNERIEKFYKEWWKKVGGLERSERFVSTLLRGAIVFVKRSTAKLSASDEDKLRKAVAAPDVEFETTPRPPRREIPLRYSFLNPLSVDLLSEDLATFIGPEGMRYGLNVPAGLARIIKEPRRPIERELLAELPADVVKLVRNGEKVIPLPKDKLCTHYYKRDDWKPWPRPMLAPLLKDLQLLEKMKLADMAALDGAISSIRVWKLGDLDNKIIPAESTILRLASMLTQNVGGGVMDLVWGPDIELLETKTDIHHFLGDTKYGPVLKAIFQGLGIPATLTGESNPGGFTNNFISLKTLTERLKYVREILRAFWENELKLVQLAMGFRQPASLVFDNLLTDEASEKALLIQLADRDLISIETIQELFGLSPEIEQVRIRRESLRRKRKQIPRKASPFHNNYEEDLAKIFATSGAFAPSELGYDLLPKKKGEKIPNETKPVNAAPPKGQPGQGRPKLKKDSKKRKQKVVKPRTSATFVANLAVAENMQARIAQVLTPAYLAIAGKKNQRELSDEEVKSLELTKFAVLCQLPLGEPSEEKIISSLENPLQVPAHVKRLLSATLQQYAQTGKSPTLEIQRRFQASVYALHAGRYEEDTSSSHRDGIQAVSGAPQEPGENP